MFPPIQPAEGEQVSVYYIDLTQYHSAGSLI